jgi:opacity protein-like surface antigen
VSICTVSQMAAAADIPVAKAPPMVRVDPAANWTGWYIGGAVGYTSGQVTRGTPSFAPTDNLDPDGFVGAVLAGYDHQFANNLVLGARVTVPVLSLKDSTPNGFGATFQADVNWAVILTGRLGMAFGPWLPYALGGAVWGGGEATVVGVGTVKEDHFGYIVGGGVEYRFHRNWSIDANYSFISMGKEAYNFVPFGGLAVVHGFESHNFMIGANLRF